MLRIVEKNFIDFEGEDWQFVKYTLSQHSLIDSSNVRQIINDLQFNLWNHQFSSILESGEINLEEFTFNFNWAVPKILSLPSLFPLGLKEFYNQDMIKLTKKQCLGILSALFFSCSTRIHTFLDSRELCKYRCMMTYFKLMQAKTDSELEKELFCINRKKVDESYDFSYWLSNQNELKGLTVNETEKIEDFDDDYLKVDFANQFIGGGVLNFGCVQEEILFSIYPELLVSMFFCPKMKKNEALVLKGATRVANYSGYAWSFKFDGPYSKPQDPWKNTFVGIDALMFPSFQEQFSKEFICREINKAFAGFQRNDFENDEFLQPVVTGKWGCGEFGGFAPLKTLLMWIAASNAGRDMIMTTFRDRSLEKLFEVAELYKGETIGKLLDLISEHPSYDILDFLIRHKKDPKNVKKQPIPEFTLKNPPKLPNINEILKHPQRANNEALNSKFKPDGKSHENVEDRQNSIKTNYKPPVIPEGDTDDIDDAVSGAEAKELLKTQDNREKNLNQVEKLPEEDEKLSANEKRSDHSGKTSNKDRDQDPKTLEQEKPDLNQLLESGHTKDLKNEASEEIKRQTFDEPSLDENMMQIDEPAKEVQDILDNPHENDSKQETKNEFPEDKMELD